MGLQMLSASLLNVVKLGYVAVGILEDVHLGAWLEALRNSLVRKTLISSKSDRTCSLGCERDERTPRAT